MAAWKMIGFPGARYDYRDYVSKHGERFPLPPVALRGRPGWNVEELKERPWRRSFRRSTSVLVGFGWTGAIMGQELTDAGLQRARARARRLARHADRFRDRPSSRTSCATIGATSCSRSRARETLTFRNNANETALPMRHLGSFLPGTGVGGAGMHWNGQTWRFLPSDFMARSHNDAALRQRS